ncbi:PhzF family phenazine biosynthesis isomerase [Bacillus swezeyi]|uniref:Isomerase n=1 Tax=Bacillus swezeyi TaxID=1925020 RepID=A0A1R1QM27_9BACI|nr:PhzF family phenazine biosynthesis isomerase [Bacillus swezeyi]MEC1262708.1 PhzF family phenazine biosynthesis isomerase [Bacillus swezeyi]MED2928551.1 PhzF family phenazine biosynthesis isomerase [Bacillus swezeyi]MED2945177.1 PhzF family phenazine biosynthesis isomerase [Bacillus swezeyi]MED2962880.1 PhzF family phenazine biosynthesis isomerase [Bacillus swezeyi]MED3074630.1 PhzF family phenazine biosynthesis isomerase [Bacillus swezeyi]
MKRVEVLRYDAFSKLVGKGNPAGVVIDAEHLAAEEMQQIAEKTGYNETSFLLPSRSADIQIRYFTPGHEMNLCGHATVASLYALYEKGGVEPGMELKIETKAGHLSVKTGYDDVEKRFFATLEQAPPSFRPFTGDRANLAEVLGISEEDFHEALPIVYGSTGIWTLLVPVKDLAACRRMKPVQAEFPDVLADMPRASVHPFCLETIHQDCHLHGRHFSSPYSGTSEDPVTGTASGVMGAYMKTYGKTFSKEGQTVFLIEQGQEIGKDGKVKIEVIEKNGEMKVQMTGTAVFAEKQSFEV